MKHQDILFRAPDGLFSYRAAGLLIRQDKTLVQHTAHDPTYAFPGGHVSFGETAEQSLIREFREETGADVAIQRLLWVEENFWKWGDRDCHQLCLYFLVKLCDEKQIPADGCFPILPQSESRQEPVEFSWVELVSLAGMEFYPLFAKEKVLHLSEHIEHFIERV